MTPHAKTQAVKALGRARGFDLIGIAPAGPVQQAQHYRDWLASGYGAEMRYLHQHVAARADTTRLLPGARSVICVALAYKRPDGYLPPKAAATPPARTEDPVGVIAQYARGRDYHDVLRERLQELIAQLRAHLAEHFEAAIFVDTGPVLERALAVAAGLGWIGKNTCLLNSRLGSYLLLGEALTTLDLIPDQPVAARCGTCTRCIDTCPTRALVAPHRLDSRRCLAYLTIEHRGALPADLQTALADHMFGCDLCQQVCPYNARAPVGTDPDLMADVMPAALPIRPLLHLGSGDYRRLTAGSATRRATVTMWRRTAAAVWGNTASPTPNNLAALAAAGEEVGAVQSAVRSAREQLARAAPPGREGSPGRSESFS